MIVFKIFVEVMIAEFVPIFVLSIFFRVDLDGVVGEVDELV